MKRLLLILAGLGACLALVAARPDKGRLRLLYWNIQNGMWDGQGDHYERFTRWVKEQQPDICVFCEASSIFLTGTDKSMPKQDRYLPGNWDELAIPMSMWAVCGTIIRRSSPPGIPSTM